MQWCWYSSRDGKHQNRHHTRWKREDFEVASTHLLPYDPVAKELSVANSKIRAGEISETVRAEVSSFGAKEGIGNNGVHLRYHNPEEYKPLSRKQKDKLREWCTNNPKQSTKGREYNWNENTKHNKGMSSAMEKQVEKSLTAAKKATKYGASEEPTNEEAQAFIMSLLVVPEKTTMAASTVKKVTLQSILKKAKNNRGCLQPSVALSLLSSTRPKGRDEPLQTKKNEMWDPGGD